MKGIWCKKVGMTQLFEDSGTLVPVTVFDTAHWVVTQLRPQAVQVGLVKDRFLGDVFSVDWLKNMQYYFMFVREIPSTELSEDVAVGMPVDSSKILAQGDFVDVSGLTIGRG